MGRVAVYPGTFDPVTNGHLDLMRRGVKLFDKVIVAVAHNPGKHPLFTIDERVSFIRQAISGWKNITVESFGNLLIHFVEDKKADVVMKGLRAVSDFEYELQMALTNRRLDNNIEAVYMMPSEEFSFLSSGIIKEVARLKGNVKGLVPDIVEKGLRERFQ